MLFFFILFFSSWQPSRPDTFFWYRDTNLSTSVEESLTNLTNKWICFLVKSDGDELSLNPENCDEMHHFFCEDTNSGKIFHESWRKCLLRNDFTWSKEKSSTAGKVKTIAKQTNVAVKTSIQYFRCKMPSIKIILFVVLPWNYTKRT